MLTFLADSAETDHTRIIFVVVAVLIYAIQAWLEKQRKARAERELNEDLARRAEERSATIEPAEYEPPLDEVYEQYREEILDRQRRMLEETEEPAPPPLPAATPPPVTAPPPVPAATTPPADTAWTQPPPAKPALTSEEKAALAAFEAYSQSKRKRRTKAPATSVRRLLSSPANLRTAVVLHEILGPPKSLAE